MKKMTNKRWSAAAKCADGACAEVEITADGNATLTSTIPGSGRLTLTGPEFEFFVNAAKAGELDDLIG